MESTIIATVFHQYGMHVAARLPFQPDKQRHGSLVGAPQGFTVRRGSKRRGWKKEFLQ
jgi:hypothetical protein